MGNKQFRAINIVVGAWLILSALWWTHSDVQFTNTWVVGLLCAGIAVAGMAFDPIRYLNAALAVWLFVSVWAFPTTVATGWNNIIAAIVMFAVAVLPTRAEGRRTRFGRQASISPRGEQRAWEERRAAERQPPREPPSMHP